MSSKTKWAIPSFEGDAYTDTYTGLRLRLSEAVEREEIDLDYEVGGHFFPQEDGE